MPAVQFKELATASGHRLGLITLAQPDTLNALTLEMTEAMATRLRRWEQAEDLVAVLLQGASGKVFCAGGDIQKLYSAICKNHAAGALVDEYAERFFEQEYRLDYQLHCYPKPVLCWGSGVVMGGGLGLFGAADYRVVTEQTKTAMPEISIGLFPDAGGTALLSSLPPGIGLFLGLTGARVHAVDALALGMATHFIEHDRLPDVLAAAKAADWQGRARADNMLMGQLLDGFVAVDDKGQDSPVAQRAEIIGDTLVGGGYDEVIQGMFRLEAKDEWFAKAVATLRRGCPVTAGIVVEQMARADNLSLAQKFQMELTVSTHCARRKDFAEGTRALLIDKDNQPAWEYSDLERLPPQVVAQHFVMPWDTHPLADLGTTA